MAAPGTDPLRRARAALARGRAEVAARLARPMVSAGSVDALHVWGLALFAEGRWAEAEAALRGVVERAPDSAQAWADLGAVLSARGYRDEPIRCYSRALALAPRDLDILRRAGEELLQLGHPALARRCLELVARERPDDPEAVAGLAMVAERRGDPERARALLAPLAARGVLTPNGAVVWARTVARLGRPRDGLEPLLRLLEAGQPPAWEAHLLFALADLLDRLGDVDGAFEAASRANALQGLRWDPDAHDAEVDELLAAFDRAFLEAAPRAEGRGEGVVLIVGMPRSGTSLVEQVLASHPEVAGLGERDELLRVRRAMPGALGEAWPGCVRRLEAPRTRAYGDWVEGRYREAGGRAAVVVDKMPDNLHLVGLAALLLPGARVVHCVRDDEDTALSCFFQEFHNGHPWATRLDWIGRRLRAARRVAAHWEALRPLPWHEVRYEELVSDFEATARELLAFCGLDWHPACAEFYRNPRFVRTASYAQVREPIHRRSVGRAARYAAHLGPLRAGLAG